MGLWGYDNKDHTLGNENAVAAKRLLAFIAGTAAFMLAILRYVPKDLFTTAAWLDKKSLGMLYVNEAAMFSRGSLWDISNVTTPVSEEAFWFAVGVSLVGIISGIVFQTVGSYTKDGQVDSLIHFVIELFSGKINGRRLNGTKMTWFFLFFLTMVFDSYTDYQFSSKFGDASTNKLEAAIYSVFTYTFMSELLLMVGFQISMSNAPEAITGAIKSIMDIITAPFKTKKGAQPKPGNNQKGSPPPQNNQKKKGNHRGSGGNNNGGGPGNENNYNRMRENGGAPVVRERPSRPEMPILPFDLED